MCTGEIPGTPGELSPRSGHGRRPELHLRRRGGSRERAGGPENVFAYDANGYRIEERDSPGKSRYGAGNGRKRAAWFRGAVIDEIVDGYLYDGTDERFGVGVGTGGVWTPPSQKGLNFGHDAYLK